MTVDEDAGDITFDFTVSPLSAEPITISTPLSGTTFPNDYTDVVSSISIAQFTSSLTGEKVLAIVDDSASEIAETLSIDFETIAALATLNAGGNTRRYLIPGIAPRPLKI